MPALEQSCANTVAKNQSRSVTATFTDITNAGNCLIASAVCAGGPAATYTISSSGGATWTLIGNRTFGDLQSLVWIAQNAPSTTSITVNGDAARSIQLRAMEYSGVHQSQALDKISVGTGQTGQAYTGLSGTTTQADSIAIAVVGSQYASTTHAGFSGGLTRLFESVSPSSYGFFQSNQDWERSRCTIHHNITASVSNFYLYALLSSIRNWIAFIICLRGQSQGPVKFSSTKTRQNMVLTGKGTLTVFGPLRATLTSSKTMVTAGIYKQSRIGPFNYQYRLGGWSGLLIGDGTPYQVESFEGLEGWELRTSDDELPRGDGSLRGVDLAASRQILFEVKVGTDLGGWGDYGALAQQTDVEGSMDTLYRALVPQRDGDWELIWRHPGRPLRMVRVRPTNLIRGLDYQQTVVQMQKFTLIAADPRHYSAFQREAVIGSVQGGAIIPKTVINQGNGSAYPNLRINGTQNVSRVELVNASYDVSFTVQAQLPAGSTLVGDMEARATGAARSVVTIDGQSKYGAWSHPRETFFLGPGQNDVHMITEPPGANVTATLTYRDTYQG